MDTDFQALLRGVATRANLTVVLHCCFGGGMVDGSSSGRGIGLSAVSQATPSILLKQGANFTGAIGVRLRKSMRANNPLPIPTYIEMRDYLRDNVIPDKANIEANPTLYNVNTLRFIAQIPSPAVSLEHARPAEPAGRGEPAAEITLARAGEGCVLK